MDKGHDMRIRSGWQGIKSIAWGLVLACCGPAAAQSLPRTENLGATGDLASEMVAGIDRFLLRETAASPERRARHWKRDFQSPDAYQVSLGPQREHLKKSIGA